MPRAFLLLALSLLAGCSGGRSSAGDPPPEAALLDVWAGLDDAFAGLAGREADVCQTPFGTWFTTFGARGLACAAAQVADPASFLARAPVTPFESGPHVATREAVRLSLAVPRDFGHYDPAFVRWLVESGVPQGAAGRALAKPIYDRRVARLARIYWLTHADLAASGYPGSTPAGPLADYAAYLSGGPVPAGAESYEVEDGYSVFAFTEQSEAVLPDVGLPIVDDWGAKYEANSAYGFWLRRRADGTHALWHDGLRQLLGALDGAWLAAHDD